MKIFTRRLPEIKDLDIVFDSEEITNYKSFMLKNIETSIDFPFDDELYYSALEHQLRHLIYKFDKGWITSNRQVIYTSDECISTVHFVMNEYKQIVQINVFQRSSNLNNLVDDVQFFNYFVNKYLPNPLLPEINILVSMPHVFKNKHKKIED